MRSAGPAPAGLGPKPLGFASAGSLASAQLAVIIAPPAGITNQIDWQFLPMAAATAAALTNGFTAFIEVSTNNGSTWLRIAEAAYPTNGGILHSAFLSKPSTHVRTRAGYFLNNPTK